MLESLPRSIIVVDDQPANLRLLTTILRRAGFTARPVTNGRSALEASRLEAPDLFLLDLEMPEMSGVELCHRLKGDPALRAIPVIFISGLQGTEERLQAFDAGAVDFVSKPFQEREVVARIRTHLELRSLQSQLERHNLQLEDRVARQVRELTASQSATLFALAKLTETRDDVTGQHIERVRYFSRLLADELLRRGTFPEQVNAEFVENIHQTAALHDIGKVGVRDAVLLKKGRLTPEEFEEIKAHPTLGATTLADVLRRYPGNRFLQMGVEVASGHHERWDGSGYPAGLAGEAIPLSARVVALADVYDALTSTRPYRTPATHDEVRAMLVGLGGTHFDPRVVEAFEGVAAQFAERLLAGHPGDAP